MPLFLDERTIDDAALVVALRLRRLADGDLQRPSTWRRIARAMNVTVEEYHAPGCGRGEFVPSPLSWVPPNPIGKIAVNTGYPLPEVAKAYAHELAHAELYRWHPPPDEFHQTFRYEDDPADIRHQIARIVETSFFRGMK